MATSRLFSKTMAKRRVATGSAVGGGTLRLDLNRDWLVREHKVKVSVSQANTGTDPTSVDVRDFISSVSLETNDGRRIFLTGAQAYDLARFRESASRVVSSLGATSTAEYAFELHHANDGALFDLMTALRSNEFTSIQLAITFAPDSANGFKGQTNPGVAAYSVDVLSYDMEQLSGAYAVQYEQLLGSFKHWQNNLGSATGTVSGQQADIQLVTGGKVRGIMMHCYDTTGSAPVLSNSIVGNLRLNINGRDYAVSTFAEVQSDNAASNGFDHTGVAMIDFGDDEIGWLDLEGVNQARLQWDVLSGAPAGWRVDFSQDYTTAR